MDRRCSKWANCKGAVEVDATVAGEVNGMLPSAPGTYALILSSDTVGSVRIGRLGILQLHPGYYVYVGSAFGSGGLRARIGHHQRKTERPHWHIDYLRRSTRPELVWYCCCVRCEHEWASRIGATPGAMVLPGFGSSDCGCETHLFWFERLQLGRASYTGISNPETPNGPVKTPLKP
jgi:Uri superfamily endonuclease